MEATPNTAIRTAQHTITLMRDDDRMGGHYGQHLYIERMNGILIETKRLDYRPYDSEHALLWTIGTAKTYGATFVDQRPHHSLYGWSSD